MKRACSPILVCIVLLLAARRALAVTTILPPQGSQPSVISPQEKVIPLYDASFALAISVASYEDKRSWRDLPSTTTELDQLSSLLQKHGFQVTRVKDPTGDELDREISKFLGGPGRNPNARIVVIFSGHGYVDRSNNTAYFVPRNSGSPTLAGSNFFVTALALEDFRSKVMRMPARHITPDTQPAKIVAMPSPARMSAVKACQAYNINLDTLKYLSSKWTADDYAILKCEISAYRALRQDAQLASAQARGAAVYEDGNTFTRKVIVGPTTYWSVNGQWTVVARRDGDALHLSFTNGWIGGKTIDRVKKITVGAYLRPPGGGNWQQRHKRPCEIPFDGSSAKGSDIFSPVEARDFQCTLQLQPDAKLAGVQVILTFDMGNVTTHMFSVPALAPTRGTTD